ncbi:MAG TPA: type II toxin-antitoxin system prevent-host-death family antitoxin [Chloroflexia bacterium]|nr:type II toxin-antitoxin system prevent-host-death family antitoxin [Chloroflexia bacterium]
MMKTVGVRELKANISEILREVDEEGQVIEVTRHGQVIARVVPARNAAFPIDRDANGAWTELKALAAEISAQWPEGVSAQDAINDARREL